MSKIVLIFGATGSGKDEAAKIAIEQGYVKVHPLEDFKRFHEKHFGMPLGSWDTTVGKNTMLNDSTSVQKFMEDFYFFALDRGIPYTKPYFFQRVRELISLEKNIVLLAIRNIHEAEVIIDAVNDFNISLQIIQLIRPGVEDIATDLKQSIACEKIVKEVSPSPIVKVIINDSDLETFRYKVYGCLSDS